MPNQQQHDILVYETHDQLNRQDFVSSLLRYSFGRDCLLASLRCLEIREYAISY